VRAKIISETLKKAAIGAAAGGIASLLFFKRTPAEEAFKETYSPSLV
jgi:hypothetical protein